MQVTLEIQNGEDRGRKLTLQAGQVVKVGRVEKAQFILRHDPWLSNLHFAVEFDGQICRLHDLQSRFGTKVNAEKVTQAELKDGDIILAGETRFAVCLSDGAAPRATEVVTSQIAVSPVLPVRAKSAPPVPPGAQGQNLLQFLRGQTAPMFALLDAARDPRILVLLRQSQEEYQSLYEGKQGEELAWWAPYLVRLPASSAFLDKLVAEGWGQSWGVYLTCQKPFAEVRKHLRHFLTVKLEGGNEVYFRFYDPRVLRVYLPTCDNIETKEFFGEISGFMMEDKESDKLVRFIPDQLGAKKETVNLLPSGVVP